MSIVSIKMIKYLYKISNNNSRKRNYTPLLCDIVTELLVQTIFMLIFNYSFFYDSLRFNLCKEKSVKIPRNTSIV